jgi:beta-galactosidase/beta-glucuronidase
MAFQISLEKERAVLASKTKKPYSWSPNQDRLAKAQAIMEQWPQGIPRSEYPRPQFVRSQWLCLNGLWEFNRDLYDQGLAANWQESESFPDFLVVPFAPQTELSSRNEQTIGPVVWYARNFEVPEEWTQAHTNLLLHFGAVDYLSTVWINGEEVGHNQGGHVPFCFDIAPYLHEGTNRICVRAEDQPSAYQPRGKQAVSGVAQGVDYYCTTGIWQSVWLEPVPAVRIQDVKITPILSHDAADALEIQVFLHAPATRWHLEVEVLDDGEIVACAEKTVSGAVARFQVPISNAKRWSPENPHLYDLKIRLLKHENVLDEVSSYAGMRSVELRDGQFLLNGEPLFLRMVLDQGYWPQSYMTAPSDAALRADVEYARDCGFNGIRKHQKVEDPRWLYWCDRLGMLVWAEMANARAWSHKAEEVFLSEWERVVRRDYNHPCIVTWVPLNESWGVPALGYAHAGQYAYVERIVALTRRLDTERPVISNDGWEQAAVTDILSIHDYTPTATELRKRYAETFSGGPLPVKTWYGPAALAPGAAYQGQPIMLTEVGGFLMKPQNLTQEKWDKLYQQYASLESPEELLEAYADLMQGLAELPFLSGFCYTQLTDIEQEINGLLTYDRKPKVEASEIANIHQTHFTHRNAEPLQQWREKQCSEFDTIFTPSDS